MFSQVVCPRRWHSATIFFVFASAGHSPGARPETCNGPDRACMYQGFWFQWLSCHAESAQNISSDREWLCSVHHAASGALGLGHAFIAPTTRLLSAVESSCLVRQTCLPAQDNTARTAPISLIFSVIAPTVSLCSPRLPAATTSRQLHTPATLHLQPAQLLAPRARGGGLTRLGGHGSVEPTLSYHFHCRYVDRRVTALVCRQHFLAYFGFHPKALWPFLLCLGHNWGSGVLTRRIRFPDPGLHTAPAATGLVHQKGPLNAQRVG